MGYFKFISFWVSHTRQLVMLDFHKVGAKNESFMGKLKLSTESRYFASLLAMRVYNIW